MGSNLNGAAQQRPTAPKRTQQEQQQHWQKNRRTLVRLYCYYIRDFFHPPPLFNSKRGFFFCSIMQ